MTRLVLLVALPIVLGGCSPRSPSGDEPAQPVPVIVQEPARNPDNSRRGSETPDVPVAAFEYPRDLGGYTVVKAVAPDTPALPPADRFGDRPRPRAVPPHLIDPDETPPARPILPPLVVAPGAAVLPVQPPEQVPTDLGAGAGSVPNRPVLPITAGVTERSRNINLPPPLPILSRQLTDRVSLDDPTLELGHAAVTEPVVKMPLSPAAFLRVVVPDPFELGEQVKPRVPSEADPGLMPVPVDPKRVK